MHFEFYVINYNFNKKNTFMFNIFDNILVQKNTEEAIKKYLRSPKNFKHTSLFEKPIYGLEALYKEIDTIISWQERGRCEYEIVAGYKFEHDIENLKAWDCYDQAHANIKTIVHDCIRQYKEQLKESKTKSDEKSE